jgi:hypothetical protein
VARKIFLNPKSEAEHAHNIKAIDRYIREMNRRLKAINWRKVPKVKGNGGGGTPPPPAKYP